MQNLLHEIQETEGVRGVMVSSRDGELFAISGDITTFHLEDTFDLENLPLLASIINEFQLKQHGLQFSFENLYLDIRMMNQEFFIIICNPDIDVLNLDRSIKKMSRYLTTDEKRVNN